MTQLTQLTQHKWINLGACSFPMRWSSWILQFKPPSGLAHLTHEAILEIELVIDVSEQIHYLILVKFEYITELITSNPRHSLGLSWALSIRGVRQAELARCRERAQSAANAAERVISDKRPRTQTEPFLRALVFLAAKASNSFCKTNSTIVLLLIESKDVNANLMTTLNNIW